MNNDETPRTDAGTEISNNLHSCGIISARDIERVAMQINNNRGFVKMSDYEGQVGKKQEALQRIIGLIKELTAAQQQIEELKKEGGIIQQESDAFNKKHQAMSISYGREKSKLSLATNQIAALRDGLKFFAAPWTSGHLNGAIPSKAVAFTKQDCMNAASLLSSTTFPAYIKLSDLEPVREALKKINTIGGCGYYVHEIVDSALATLTKLGETK